MSTTERPEEIPETAIPSFGGSIWSAGNDLYVCRGKAVFGPDRIRVMSDHKETKQELIEFWSRYLKDETLGEAVADWLIPLTDEEIKKAQEGPIKPEDRVGARPRTPADQCECWGSDNFGGVCLRCGHGLKCENCCHQIQKAPAAPTTVPVVASAPVEIKAEVPSDSPVVHRPDLPRCACGSGLPEYEGGCPACYPVAAEAEAIENAGQMAIVKAAPRVIVREEDRWWEDPEAMDTLKKLIGRGATDFQARWMLWFCRGMGLNPFTGEARWSDQWGRPVIDVTGYQAHANRRPEFRRMLSGKVYEGETWSYDEMTGILKHEIGMDQDPAKFLFAYAIVYRGDRESPTLVTQSIKEFMPGWKPWSGSSGRDRKIAAKNAGYDAFPADKLQSKAERKALAKAFSLGGMSEEDIRDGDTGE